MTFDDWWGAYPTQEDYEANCRDAWEAGVASRDAEIERLQEVVKSAEQNAILNAQKVITIYGELAEREKQVAMLRYAMGAALFAAREGYKYNFECELWTEALAATQDLSGLVLCDAEPVGTVQHLHELNDGWIAKLPVGTPLYTRKP